MVKIVIKKLEILIPKQKDKPNNNLKVDLMKHINHVTY